MQNFGEGDSRLGVICAARVTAACFMDGDLLILAQTALVLAVWCAVTRLTALLPSRSNRRRALSQHAIDAATPKAPPLKCCSGVPHRPPPSLLQASHAWGGNYWATINLRDGPDYKHNRIKRPALAPLLPCVGLDAFRTTRKVFTDCSEAQAACLPAEVLDAARSAPKGKADLPSFLLVSVHMPAYTGPAADGPTLKFVVYFAVPPSLADDTSGAATLLCDFLRSAASGHREPSGDFYDRFKVIARMLHQEDQATNFFLRRMIEQFNGKPMLWRFFGVWGDCCRRGGVACVNLDFCTGGRIKNAALFQAATTLGSFVGDLSWCLESRADVEMPERLIGGATIVRIDVRSLPTLDVGPSGAVRLVAADGDAWQALSAPSAALSAPQSPRSPQLPRSPRLPRGKAPLQAGRAELPHRWLRNLVSIAAALAVVALTGLLAMISLTRRAPPGAGPSTLLGHLR